MNDKYIMITDFIDEINMIIDENKRLLIENKRLNKKIEEYEKFILDINNNNGKIAEGIIQAAIKGDIKIM